MNAYLPLMAGYAAALVFLGIVSGRGGTLWSESTPESGIAPVAIIASVLGILAIGQLYQRGLLLPETTSLRTLARTINQLLIFLPVWILIAFAARRGADASRSAAFLPLNRIWMRIGTGVGAATLALIAYRAARPDAASSLVLLGRIASPVNLPHAAQILGEDVAIGIVLAALLSRAGNRMSAVIVGVLFALAHVPAMLGRADHPGVYFHLVGDAFLTSGALLVMIRLRDVWPLWPVHVAMDLMQFYGAR